MGGFTQQQHSADVPRVTAWSELTADLFLLSLLLKKKDMLAVRSPISLPFCIGA
jgi:hypothetical protein